jgi:hypothetical protein
MCAGHYGSGSTSALSSAVSPSPSLADRLIRSMHKTRKQRLYTLAFERKTQSVQLNVRNTRRVNDAIPPNIGGTHLELSVRRLSFARQYEQPEHDLERRGSF